MKLIGLLKEESTKGRMMRLLKDMGYSKQDAEEELDEITHCVKNLPEQIKLYRILAVDGEDKINTKELGCHYSTSRKDLLSSHSYVTGSGEEHYIITVMSPKNLVDVNETIANRILYPNDVITVMVKLYDWFMKDYYAQLKFQKLLPNRKIENSAHILDLMKAFQPRINNAGKKLKRKFHKLYSLDPS